MRSIWSRLRAALTPQAIGLLAAAVLIVGALVSSRYAQSTHTALEKRLGQTLSAMEGAGQVNVVIMTRSETSGTSTWGSAQSQDVPCGAVAVAQGADDPLVRMELEAALCALLGLPASAVSVVTGGK